MQTIAGLWIDHRRAVIVTVSEDGEMKKRITSSIEKQLRRSGRSRPRPTYESRGTEADNSREREYRGQPADFYDEIIACIGAATTILIFGPGEAKDELRKRIEQKADAKRTVRLATAGQMTDEEIVEKVRRQFRVASKSSASTGGKTPPKI
jgi:stalled ribosome rescue protein Dom34